MGFRKNNLRGLAHTGLPTNDMQKTVNFYESIGFEIIMQTRNEKADEAVTFMQLGTLCIEIYENRQAAMAHGAWDHVAIDVEDVEEIYQYLVENQYEIISQGIEELPFWEKGVRFCIIQGPNHEKVEFCQRLS